MLDTSEVTPLLSDTESLGSEESESHTPSSQWRTARFYQVALILSALSADFAIMGFAFNLGAVAFSTIRLGKYHLPWSLRHPVHGMISVNILAFLASYLNISRLKRRRLPLWLRVNLIIDAVITFYALSFGLEGLVSNFDESPSYWLPDKVSFNTAKRAQRLIGLGMGFGVALGVTHLALFLLRSSWPLDSQSRGLPQESALSINIIGPEQIRESKLSREQQKDRAVSVSKS